MVDKIDSIGLKRCAISEITKAELIYGAAYSANPLKNYRLIATLCEDVTTLPVTRSIFSYGKEKARLRKTGTMISDLDLLIGCTAVAHELTMVTGNVSEFKRISQIEIENWTKQDV